MEREDRVERRKHKRFQAKNGTFAALKARGRKLWQILDISRGGLAFRYVTTAEELEESPKLDILTSDTRFSVEEIPIRNISDSEIVKEYSSSNLGLRRRSVQFGKLTDDQRSQLEYFIHNHTLGEV